MIPDIFKYQDLKIYYDQLFISPFAFQNKSESCFNYAFWADWLFFAFGKSDWCVLVRSSDRKVKPIGSILSFLS